MAITIVIFILSLGLALSALAQTSTAAPTKTPPNFHTNANPVASTLKPGTKETVIITIASQTKFARRVFCQLSQIKKEYSLICLRQFYFRREQQA
jgi:hypothetical protein